MWECLQIYREFINRGRYKPSNEAERECLSTLLWRNIEDEEVRLEELYPSPKSNRVFESPLDLLTGNWPTPLLKIDGSEKEAWAKLEWYNPFSNSIKDRTVYALLKFIEGDYLVEVSSGNVAIAISALGKIMGKRIKVYLPSASTYIAPVLDILGVPHQVLDVTMTVEALEHLQKDIKEGAKHPNQFQNDLNFLMHLRTAAEIDWQFASIGKKPDYIVASIGTSGHAAALGLYFGAKYGSKLIAVQPEDWIPGIR